MTLRALVAVAAVALLLGGCGSGAPGTRKKALGTAGGQTILHITVQDPGSEPREATMSCLGTFKAGGYLDTHEAITSACITAMTSGPVVNYLRSRNDSHIDPRSRCAAIEQIPREQRFTTIPAGRAEVSGVYNGFRIHRTVDAVSGGACDRALWLLMGPLFAPAMQPVIAEYPDNSR